MSEPAPPTRASIAAALEEEESRLRRLEAERAEVAVRAESLRARLVALDVPPRAGALPVVQTHAPQSSAQKVKLFRQLFHGRDDVYPTRFVSRKTGKPGYAPACANKFVVGVCPLPKVKCGDCTNQAFRPVDDRAVRDHLQGRHVMGVYPILPDETCWFLAADFDKSTWKEDARAFAETARRLGLPVLVERSRSGNGAHVWFFFSEPVSVALARRMGCHVITETMSARHELSMDSYDRLFPSQDTMPRGGFGNLIALPLQREPRQHANSVFLDDNLNPYPDGQQWSVLASARRISLVTVERIASDAARAGAVVGLRLAEAGDDEEDAPWTRAPSGAPRPRPIKGPLPARVSAVLAQRLFVEKQGLPSPLLNQIKRLAAFQNPEFYKKESMRLSTATTPRVIARAEDLPKHVALPRGCAVYLEELLRAHGVSLDVVDERASGTPINVRFQGMLTPVQESAARALLAHHTGVFVAPPGVGKTVIGTYLVASRAQHARPCPPSTLARSVGRAARTVSGHRSKGDWPDPRREAHADRAYRRRDDPEPRSQGLRRGSRGRVRAGHRRRVPSPSRSAVRARPPRGEGTLRRGTDGDAAASRRASSDHRDATRSRAFQGRREVAGRCAPVRSSARRPRDRVPCDGLRRQGRHPGSLRCASARRSAERNDPQRCRSRARGRSVSDSTHGTQGSSRVLREPPRARRAPPRRAPRRARREGRSRGAREARGDSAERRTPAPRDGPLRRRGLRRRAPRHVVPRVPVSWKGTLVQYTGRLHRLHPGKREVRIFDYVDREVPMLSRMFEKRLRGYRAIGYARGEAPLGYAEPKDDLIVEYDEDVLRTLDHESATDRDDEFAEWVP